MMCHELKDAKNNNLIAAEDYILGYKKEIDGSITVYYGNGKKNRTNDKTVQYLDIVMERQAIEIARSKDFERLMDQYNFYKKSFKNIIPFWVGMQGMWLLLGSMGAYKTKESYLVVNLSLSIGIVVFFTTFYKSFYKCEDLKRVKCYAGIKDALNINPDLDVLSFASNCSKKTIKMLEEDGQIKINRLGKYSLKDMEKISDNLERRPFGLVKK